MESRMKSCQDLEALVTPYVDEQASAAERAAVDAHLDACPPCRDRVHVEQTMRQVVRARATTIAGHAPAELQARCRAAAPRAEGHAGARGWLALPQWLPASMAVALVLAVAGVFVVGLNNRLHAALAAQLTLDHVKCFAYAGQSAPAADARVVEATLEKRLGWDVDVPASSAAEDLHLVGASRCLYSEGELAHVLYRRHGRPMSLFVLRRSGRARQVIEMMGHEAVFWTHGGKMYALVGRETRAEMERVAAYVRGAVHE